MKNILLLAMATVLPVMSPVEVQPDSEQQKDFSVVDTIHSNNCTDAVQNQRIYINNHKVVIPDVQLTN